MRLPLIDTVVVAMDDVSPCNVFLSEKSRSASEASCSNSPVTDFRGGAIWVEPVGSFFRPRWRFVRQYRPSRLEIVEALLMVVPEPGDS